LVNKWSHLHIMAILTTLYPIIEDDAAWGLEQIEDCKIQINNLKIAIQNYYNNGIDSYSIDTGQTKQSRKSIGTLQKDLFQFVNYLKELELHYGVRSGTIQVRSSCYVHDEDTAI
jgi:hypothetical protein